MFSSQAVPASPMSANETSSHVTALWTSEDADLISVLIAQMK